MDLFGGEEDQWPINLERIHRFFTANDVPKGKRRLIFLKCCGSATYALLRDLAKPDTPREKTLEQISDNLGKHYNPALSDVVQRSRFNIPTRREGRKEGK